jgi:hypothetical protein
MTTTRVPRRTDGSPRRLTGKTVLFSAIATVVLFLVAAPFGHSHHGAGLIMSDIFWPLFLISVPVLLVLALVVLIQAVLARRPSRR